MHCNCLANALDRLKLLQCLVLNLILSQLRQLHQITPELDRKQIQVIHVDPESVALAAGDDRVVVRKDDAFILHLDEVFSDALALAFLANRHIHQRLAEVPISIESFTFHLEALILTLRPKSIVVLALQERRYVRVLQ